jgi:hypothetical protein
MRLAAWGIGGGGVPLRGVGLQLVMVWQHLAQIRSRYPADWATIVNNSAARPAFGFGHSHAARDSAEVLGLDLSRLAALRPEEAVLPLRGEDTRKITRINYLLEPALAGLFDPNPYLAEQPDAKTEPVKPEPPTPRTWKQKLAHSRAVFAEFLDEVRKRGEDPDSVEEQNLIAIMHLADVVEEFGRRMPPGVEKKRPNRRKKGDRGV